MLNDVPSRISGDAEQTVLAKLNCLKHENPLELLGSYRLQESINLLFSLASASLGAYWAPDGILPAFPSELEVILALPGLASALQALHVYRTEDVSLTGCHHDIKPDNILVINGNQWIRHPFPGRPGVYFSPESEDYEDDFARHRIRRSSDIWSLGCVFLELMTFLSSGANGVAEFRQNRKVTFGDSFTTATFHHGKKRNPGVVRQFEKLRGAAGEDASRDLIQLVEEMLQIDPGLRPMAVEVSRRIRALALKHMLRLVRNDFSRPASVDVPFDFLLEEERLHIWEDTVVKSRCVSDNETTFNEAIRLLTKLHRLVQPPTASQVNIHTISGNLRRINDRLAGLPDRDTETRVPRELELRILTLHGELDAIPSGNSHYQHIAMLAALKHALILTQTGSNHPTRTWQLDASSLYNIAQPDTEFFETARFISTTSGTPPQDVVIQHLICDAKWASKPIGETLFARLHALVDFLRAAFRSAAPPLCILECPGYTPKPSHHAFALAFAFPSLTASVSKPIVTTHRISLNRLIRETKNVRLRPDLGDIFHLATRLVACILEYHSIGWLHKSFSSYQVVFFLSKGVYAIRDPFVVGFDSSRPDRPSEYSEGPKAEAIRSKHQHPAYGTGEYRFRPEFENFSLGYVLLELGLWKSLDEILVSGPPSSQRQKYTRFLLEADEYMMDARHGPDDPMTWMHIGAVANIHYQKGDYSAALELQRQVVKNLTKLRGETDVFALSAMGDLSLFLARRQDKLEEASDLLFRALAGIRNALGEDHPSTLSLSNDMASILYQRRDLAQAESLFQRVLDAKINLLGMGNQSTLATMGNLAVVTRHRGDLVKAEHLTRRTLQIRQDILPADTAVLQMREDFAGAQEFATLCLEGSRRTLGNDHPDTYVAMHNLAPILRRRGNLVAALELYTEAWRRKQRHPGLGPTHSSTLGTISSMGVLYHDMKRFEDARRCFLTGLEALEAQTGANDDVVQDMLVLDMVEKLAEVCLALGKTDEAETYRQRGAQIQQGLSSRGVEAGDGVESLPPFVAEDDLGL
ncbi:hypothetical protein OQA88_6056 [Cercophora sp. LCS_1]